MKKYLLLYVLVLLWCLVSSQDICDDLIYAIDGNKIIMNCCIEKVVDGNLVVYTKGGDTLQVKAVAIKKSGQYMELEAQGGKKELQFIGDDEQPVEMVVKDYRYYKQLYDGSKTRAAFGLFFTVIGGGFEIAGLIFSKKEYVIESFNVDSGDLFLAGAVSISVGVPLLISGQIRAANNKKEMDKLKNDQSLSLGFSPQGIGLRYRF